MLSRAAPARASAKRKRSAGSLCHIRTAQVIKADKAKAKPPIQTELSNPATTTRTNVSKGNTVGCETIRLINSIARMADEAEAICCGTQADWNSHPAKPVGSAST